MRLLAPRQVRIDEAGREAVNYRTIYPYQPGERKQAFCGHMVDVKHMPRTNCKQCWTFYFISNAEFTQAVGNDLIAGKEAALVTAYGNKFVSKAKWFFATVAKAKEASDIISKELEAEGLTDPSKPMTYDVVFKPTGDTGVIQGSIEETVQ